LDFDQAHDFYVTSSVLGISFRTPLSWPCF